SLPTTGGRVVARGRIIFLARYSCQSKSRNIKGIIDNRFAGPSESQNRTNDVLLENCFLLGGDVKIVEIDRSKTLAQQPNTGHNRWHPDIPAIVEADPGEEVVLQTRDALDGQFNAKTTEADFAKLNPGPIHPLTGPVLIKGAKPGDLLEIEFLDIRPEPF